MKTSIQLAVYQAVTLLKVVSVARTSTFRVRSGDKVCWKNFRTSWLFSRSVCMRIVDGDTDTRKCIYMSCAKYRFGQSEDFVAQTTDFYEISGQSS